MSSRLEDILKSKAREIASMDRDAVERAAERTTRAPLDVVQTLSSAPLSLIAEIKHRSPSAGPLSTALSPGERALRYVNAGASMVSVLCDAPFFGGSWDHVREVRRSFDVAGLATPILAKEFVLDDVQIARAREAGADSVLLIARILDKKALGERLRRARALGLEPLVEVVNERELEDALDLGATILGVNARDLDTLVIDPERTARVLRTIPNDRVAVHLSGVKTPDDVATIAAGRADAALLGEALMRTDDPSPLLAAMHAKTTRRADGRDRRRP